MKFVIKQTFPKTISLKSNGKQDYETVSTTVDFPDYLVNKGIAVIDELLDRTWDELENIASKQTEFPLVPFPFFHKYREPDDARGDYWITLWLDTSLYEIINERTKIIELLGELGGLNIEKNPSVNLETGVFDGDKFEVTLERNKLTEIREKFRQEYLKLRDSIIEVNLENVNHLEALFILRMLYSKVIEILEVACNSYVTYRDTKLNYFYVTFVDIIDKLLERNEFEELEGEKPELLESLVGELHRISMTSC